MKKWAFILCIAILAASCNSLLRSKPSGTLSEEEMIDILVDIHLTEATLRMANDSVARLNDTTELRNRFAQVFRKHDVDPDDFNTSLNYYIQHIEQLDKIYVEVINRLTEMEAGLLQKTTKPPGGIYKRPRTGQNPAQLNNPWYKSMNKIDEPAEIHYFDSTRYPAAFEIQISPYIIQ